MTRDVFPREADRAVIAAFMQERTLAHPDSPLASISGAAASLVYNAGTIVRPAFVSLAWFATSDGALYGKLLHNIAYNPGVRVVHHILDLLGLPGARVVREMPGWSGGILGTARYFFDGQRVEIDQPFLMCGPLGVQAWRATTVGD